MDSYFHLYWRVALLCFIFRQESYIWNWATQENIHGFHICCRFLIHAQNQSSNWTVCVCLQNMPLIGSDTMCVVTRRDVSVVFCVSLGQFSGVHGEKSSPGPMLFLTVFLSLKSGWCLVVFPSLTRWDGSLTGRQTGPINTFVPSHHLGASVDARFHSSTKIHKTSLNSLLNSRVALSHRVNCYDFYLWKSFCLCTVCSSEKWDFLPVDENYVLTENHFLCSHP